MGQTSQEITENGKRRTEKAGPHCIRRAQGESRRAGREEVPQVGEEHRKRPGSASKPDAGPQQRRLHDKRPDCWQPLQAASAGRRG